MYNRNSMPAKYEFVIIFAVDSKVYISIQKYCQSTIKKDNILFDKSHTRLTDYFKKQFGTK